MELRHLYKGLLLVSMCVSLTACNDWLDVQPKSQVEDTELFESETGFKEALAGVYSSMVSDDTYTKEMMFGTIGILGQEWTEYSSTYTDLADYDYTTSTSESIIDGIWTTSYNSIANVNNLLEYIDDKKSLFSNDNYYIIKGEALALRAFLHFDLLRCFGVSYAVNSSMPSIPYCTTLTYSVYPQLTVKAVAESVEADLLEAEELLKVDPILTGEEITELDDNGYLMNRQVHLNYYAVKGLEARLYMWMQEYDKAAACAEVVIDSDAFEWSDGDDMRLGYDYSFAPEQLFALNNVNLSTLFESYFTEDNTSAFSLNATNLLDYYDSNTDDYRYVYLFESGTSGDYVDYRYLLKYGDTTSDDDYYANKMPLIRLSEMYLILSECDYRNGGDGLDALNKLRVARNVGELTTAPSNYYTELVREYRREFIGEGQLFFLYKRLNRSSVIGSDADMVSEKAYTFPLPQSETDAAEREDNR